MEWRVGKVEGEWGVGVEGWKDERVEGWRVGEVEGRGGRGLPDPCPGPDPGPGSANARFKPCQVLALHGPDPNPCLGPGPGSGAAQAWAYVPGPALPWSLGSGPRS